MRPFPLCLILPLAAHAGPVQRTRRAVADPTRSAVRQVSACATEVLLSLQLVNQSGSDFLFGPPGLTADSSFTFRESPGQAWPVRVPTMGVGRMDLRFVSTTGAPIRPGEQFQFWETAEVATPPSTPLAMLITLTTGTQVQLQSGKVSQTGGYTWQLLTDSGAPRLVVTKTPVAAATAKPLRH